MIRLIDRLKSLAKEKVLDKLDLLAEGHVRVVVIHLGRPDVESRVAGVFGTTPHIPGGINAREITTRPLCDGYACTVLDVDQVLTAEQEAVMTDLSTSIMVNAVIDAIVLP